MLTVPFVNLAAQFRDLEGELTEAFLRVGRSGQYILGDEVTGFEGALAELCGCTDVVSVANATDGLTLALKALDIGAGDEVITAPNSFIASAGAIAAAGATIRFADVGADFNLDPRCVLAAITPATKAIIPVHLTGNPADMDRFTDIGRTHGLAVIEDAAQAIGATYRGRKVGNLGHLACFSLHPLKNLGLLGDAGAIATSDPQLAAKLRRLRNHGLINRDESTQWGLNSRLDALQAAFGRVKLRYLPRWTARFRAIAAHYHERLGNLVQCPIHRAEDAPVYHNFVVQAVRRDELMEELAKQGVETKIHYPIPLHLMRAGQSLGYGTGSFPLTEQQSKRIVSLPIYPELTDSQVEHVVASVRNALSKTQQSAMTPQAALSPL
jgi:dTDP-4-amino-4,6-dideoxygalactose transaminase